MWRVTQVLGCRPYFFGQIEPKPCFSLEISDQHHETSCFLIGMWWTSDFFLNHCPVACKALIWTGKNGFTNFSARRRAAFHWFGQWQVIRKWVVSKNLGWLESDHLTPFGTTNPSSIELTYMWTFTSLHIGVHILHWNWDVASPHLKSEVGWMSSRCAREKINVS